LLDVASLPEGTWRATLPQGLLAVQRANGLPICPTEATSQVSVAGQRAAHFSAQWP
jgi:hypothetical protein